MRRKTIINMTILAEQTQTSQELKRDFKRNSLDSLTFGANPPGKFNSGYQYSSSDYSFHFSKYYLERWFSQRFTESERRAAHSLLQIPANFDHVRVGYFQEKLGLGYDAAARRVRSLVKKGILRVHRKYHSATGKSFEYKFTNKFKNFLKVLHGSAKGKVKMNKALERDSNLSWPAKLLYSVIDNNCNSMDMFFYDYEKVTGWLKRHGESKELSHGYLKKLIKELEDNNWLSKKKNNLYILERRSARVQGNSVSAFRTKLQTNTRSSYNSINYKCSYKKEREEIIFYDHDNKENSFKLRRNGKFDIIYDKHERSRLDSMLKKLGLKDLTRLFCWIYGIDYSIRAKKEGSCYFGYVQKLIKRALEDTDGKSFTSRENLIISAWVYSSLCQNKKKFAVSWLKQGCFFNNAKKTITPREHADFEKTRSIWQRRMGTLPQVKVITREDYLEWKAKKEDKGLAN